ncbi:hypothetical protein BJ508DRAFT_338652 [Ascobolus immersus RN42]|uniref:Uncharacterized protein n=1 Tax=Ascobolus immersus RN42 TaxID=1160509 RepID=A0A3N4HP82_ASCIM|nr:hypothetical protein BJ508DRAFT_338652 [Ascobolus immersus RN42]
MGEPLTLLPRDGENFFCHIKPVATTAPNSNHHKDYSNFTYIINESDDKAYRTVRPYSKSDEILQQLEGKVIPLPTDLVNNSANGSRIIQGIVTEYGIGEEERIPVSTAIELAPWFRLGAAAFAGGSDSGKVFVIGWIRLLFDGAELKEGFNGGSVVIRGTLFLQCVRFFIDVSSRKQSSQSPIRLVKNWIGERRFDKQGDEVLVRWEKGDDPESSKAAVK